MRSQPLLPWIGIALSITAGCAFEHKTAIHTVRIPETGYALLRLDSWDQHNRVTFTLEDAPLARYGLFFAPRLPRTDEFVGLDGTPEICPASETGQCDLGGGIAGCSQPIQCTETPGAGYLVDLFGYGGGADVGLEHGYGGGAIGEDDGLTTYRYYYVLLVDHPAKSTELSQLIFEMEIDSSDYGDGANEVDLEQLL